METVKDLVDRLNAIDECGNIEAKKAAAIDRSIMDDLIPYLTSSVSYLTSSKC